jgi:hypothetical protein
MPPGGISSGTLASPARVAPATAEAMPHHAGRPTKACTVCGRPFQWRRKWKDVWQELRYCSEQCRRAARRSPRRAVRQSPTHLDADDPGESKTIERLAG